MSHMAHHIISHTAHLAGSGRPRITCTLPPRHVLTSTDHPPHPPVAWRATSQDA
eukprot:CAMPEP_0119075338 /NCGR_PEP_ID=MMETSP1178-20130426/79239_1 /TAXON_ID=33656 /ORGANISM="unid sp, Strain CCMP2000" /LENGTH=53 /DNA_ID=CAMNT_0007057549 /DNA_START=69 /DNA_END=227 /DNA_ORIENTATION=-